MIDREQWEHRPEWLAWVRDVWAPDTGRVQQQYPSSRHPCRAQFAERAARAFRERGIPVAMVKTWVSVQLPESGAGYADEYPHIHYPLDGTTLVHYLKATDSAAPLDIFDGDEVIEVVRPYVGLTVFMPNALKHGVRKQRGNEDRVQLIATALP